MNEIVEYENDLNKIKLGLLTEKEQDLFFTLIYKARGQDTENINLDFLELKHLIEVKHNDRFINHLTELSIKLLQLTQTVKLPDGKIVIFNLFNRFVIDPNQSTLTIKVSEDFKFILNDLKQFTVLELKQLIKLKSKYLKTIYRLLSQFKSSAWLEITIEDFKNILEIPETYKMSDIDKQILNPCLIELSECFKNLKIEKKKKGVKVSSLRFTWSKKLQKKEKIDLLTSKEKQLKETGVYIKPSCSYEEIEEAHQVKKDLISEADKPAPSFTKEQEERAIKILCEERGVSLSFLENLKKKMVSAYIHTIKEALKNNE
ncbi:replication initiation protein [Cetobacterium sp.]|uniref:replication initiation protein n=1 Tax=Cetobacterium sp. TaxID=2071632 RepID=UPI003F2C21B7